MNYLVIYELFSYLLMIYFIIIKYFIILLL
jgi:hypothetical protein